MISIQNQVLRKIVLTAAISSFALQASVVSAAPVSPAAVVVEDKRANSLSQLQQQSSLIALGQFSTALKEYPTNRTVYGGKLVNYVQTFLIRKTYKGTTLRTVKVINTGVFPRPLTTSPLNLVYPGPFAENEDYVVFLRPVPGTEFYSLVGILQGIYPVVRGRSIAFRGFGFGELHDLPLQEMEKRIRQSLTLSSDAAIR
ncbi:hypothetical protein [Paenibacillus gansuensis]|uniref:Uncharacterized protein n=1 Tax=Paenibacillus gansuensis TaxID=306542 RepID=A0ABW5PAY3_9BACL